MEPGNFSWKFKDYVNTLLNPNYDDSVTADAFSEILKRSTGLELSPELLTLNFCLDILEKYDEGKDNYKFGRAQYKENSEESLDGEFFPDDDWLINFFQKRVTEIDGKLVIDQNDVPGFDFNGNDVNPAEINHACVHFFNNLIDVINSRFIKLTEEIKKLPDKIKATRGLRKLRHEINEMIYNERLKLKDLQDMYNMLSENPDMSPSSPEFLTKFEETAKKYGLNTDADREQFLNDIQNKFNSIKANLLNYCDTELRDFQEQYGLNSPKISSASLETEFNSTEMNNSSASLANELNSTEMNNSSDSAKTNDEKINKKYGKKQADKLRKVNEFRDTQKNLKDSFNINSPLTDLRRFHVNAKHDNKIKRQAKKAAKGNTL